MEIICWSAAAAKVQVKANVMKHSRCVASVCEVQGARSDMYHQVMSIELIIFGKAEDESPQYRTIY